MITRDEADSIREQLLAVLDEDAHNTQRLLDRLETITRESGIAAHAALLLILTHLSFEKDEARRHWEAILAHRQEMSRLIGRDAGVRVAALDYFMNVNRRLVRPALVDLEMVTSGEDDAEIDGLTGLVSGRKFHSGLQAELRRARRYAQKACVVLIDVDRFREANREFGELVCDRLLRELAIILKNNTRDIDIAARPGEDEMALLLPETDRNGAFMVAERFRREVETYFQHREGSGKPVGLTVSAGVACYPQDATSADSLLEHCAQALYEAKASGRNVVRVYGPDRRRYLRFDLEPGRFEVEVLGRSRPSLRPRNLSRSGILFTSPEVLEVGEELEIRVIEAGQQDAGRLMKMRGRVVRLEELDGRPDDSGDRFEIGVALDLAWDEGTGDLLEFLERARGREVGGLG